LGGKKLQKQALGRSPKKNRKGGENSSELEERGDLRERKRQEGQFSMENGKEKTEEWERSGRSEKSGLHEHREGEKGGWEPARKRKGRGGMRWGRKKSARGKKKKIRKKNHRRDRAPCRFSTQTNKKTRKTVPGRVTARVRNRR